MSHSINSEDLASDPTFSFRLEANDHSLAASFSEYASAYPDLEVDLAYRPDLWNISYEGIPSELDGGELQADHYLMGPELTMPLLPLALTQPTQPVAEAGTVAIPYSWRHYRHEEIQKYLHPDPPAVPEAPQPSRTTKRKRSAQEELSEGSSKSQKTSSDQNASRKLPEMSYTPLDGYIKCNWNDKSGNECHLLCRHFIRSSDPLVLERHFKTFHANGKGIKKHHWDCSWTDCMERNIPGKKFMSHFEDHFRAA